MFEIIIEGKFTTGTTIDDEEKAKKYCQELLLRKLQESGCAGGLDGVFDFKMIAIKANPLMKG